MQQSLASISQRAYPNLSVCLLLREWTLPSCRLNIVPLVRSGSWRARPVRETWLWEERMQWASMHVPSVFTSPISDGILPLKLFSSRYKCSGGKMNEDHLVCGCEWWYLSVSSTHASLSNVPAPSASLHSFGCRSKTNPLMQHPKFRFRWVSSPLDNFHLEKE